MSCAFGPSVPAKPLAPKAIVILCAAPDEEVGARLARGLVDAELAACVNVITAMRSFYRWEGEVHDEAEVQLVIKTRASLFDAVRRWLEAHHPYEIPEVVSLSIGEGNAAYLEWLERQTRGGG